MFPSVNQGSINNDVMTSIFSESSETCNASCSANQSGNVVIIENSTIGGDAGFEESCTANATCIMEQQLDTQLSNILSAIASQSNSSVQGIFGDIGSSGGFNVADVTQTIKNYITQMEESTCTASATFDQSNNLFYASNSDIAGFAGFQIGIDTPASANASCTMTNLSRIVVYNNAQSSTNQTNTQVSLIGIIVIGIIICSLLGFILFFFRGGSSAPKEDSLTDKALLSLSKDPLLSSALTSKVPAVAPIITAK